MERPTLSDILDAFSFSLLGFGKNNSGDSGGCAVDGVCGSLLTRWVVVVAVEAKAVERSRSV